MRAEAIPMAPGPMRDAAVVHELILGGQRSGKSRRAELLAAQWLNSGATPPHEGLFVATALAHDDDMRARIARHRADRQQQLPGMQTVEEPHDLAGVITRHSQPHRLLVIDCLTLWLANHYDRIDGFIESPEVAALLQTIDTSPGPLVFVSNEIGLGVIPMGREVRAYVDTLGWLNQQVAARCHRVCLMAAGLPLVLKDTASVHFTDSEEARAQDLSATGAPTTTAASMDMPACASSVRVSGMHVNNDSPAMTAALLQHDRSDVSRDPSSFTSFPSVSRPSA